MSDRNYFPPFLNRQPFLWRRMADELEQHTAAVATLAPAPGINIALEQVAENQALLPLVNNHPQHNQHLHLCLVVETSACVADPLDPCPPPGHDGPNWSILDLLLHYIKNVIACLEPNDILSIITYSNRGRVLVPPTRVDGCDIEAILNSITASDCEHSHLWGGILEGLSCLREYEPGEHGRRYNVCTVLTRGRPNRTPASGWRQAHSAFQNTTSFADYTLNVVGFGSALDYMVLMLLARNGGGVYASVSGWDRLGTVLTNMLASARVTTHKRLTLSSNSEWFQGVAGDYKTRRWMTSALLSWAPWLLGKSAPSSSI